MSSGPMAKCVGDEQLCRLRCLADTMVVEDCLAQPPNPTCLNQKALLALVRSQRLLHRPHPLPSP